MNSTIFVQQNIGIPGGPMTSEDTTTSAHSQVKKKSVGAIIRPMAREDGKPGTVRLDPADQNTPKAHVRNHDLDDYVKWLREKIKRDEQDVRTRNVTSIEPLSRKQGNRSAPTVRVQSSIPSKANPTPSNDITPPVVMPDTSDQQSSRSQGFSTKNLLRVDQPHAGVSEAYLKFDELRAQHEKQQAEAVIAENREAGGQDSVRTQQPTSQSELIDKIAKAIASVLTETSEQIIDQKLGDQNAMKIATAKQVSIEEANQQSVQLASDVSSETASIPNEEISNVEVDKLDRATLAELVHAGGKPVAEMESEAAKITSEILEQLDVPTSVAAWDVEDFRWPVITNRMIVSGGEALDQLSRSVFEMISPTNQRVAVTGVDRGEGTTSIAVSVARWAAACGKQVLLVDADLATGSLTQQVGLAPNISWVNSISQSLPAAEVIVRSQQSNMCIMPLAEMVSSVTWPRFIYDHLGEVIDQVRDHFDLIVLDVGPANQMMSELSRSSLLADATLMVHDGVNSPEFQKTKNRLNGFGLSRMIIAENRTQHAAVNVA
jgi:Mrp family chromosome partitioning ATPase